ncbi:MAG: MBL fold metallo-hydrolase [Clostridiales bacterium]|nr:MBL fold metallo-hydrolase [Clostridiales bacterium]
MTEESVIASSSDETGSSVSVTEENPSSLEEPEVSSAESSENVTDSSVEESSISKETEAETIGFEVYFLDVGQGDSALVCCDNHYMLIDGGPSKSSDVVYSFLKNHEITNLDYIVATHPDEDHIGGIPGALEFSEVEEFLSPVEDDDSYSFRSILDRLQKQQAEFVVPSCGMEFDLGSAHCFVVGPVENAGKLNNRSIVIRIVYGNTSFLFTGDAESEEEESILQSGQTLSSDVMKVSHHGSEYSTTDMWLDAVRPSIAIISCGQGNDFGFPTNPVLERLKEHGISAYRTDLQGDILVRSDGETISVETEKETDMDVFSAPEIEPAEPDDGLEHDYIINTKTGKFHKPDCEAVSKMDEKNRKEYHGTRTSLIEEGYVPCKMCNP